MTETTLLSEEEQLELRTKWAKWTKHRPLTRTQSDFVNHLIQNANEINKIGELQSTFDDFYKFIKHFNK